MIKRSGKKDGCMNLEKKSEDVEMGLQILGLPKNCPIYKVSSCRVFVPLHSTGFTVRPLVDRRYYYYRRRIVGVNAPQ